jgi:ABC-type Fe3+-siderophore transport system permease subunit
MMIDAGTKASSALSWLYGSFASITWDKVWLVLVPSAALSLVPLVWARELNLVLLGEDQARQMGARCQTVRPLDAHPRLGADGVLRGVLRDYRGSWGW